MNAAEIDLDQFKSIEEFYTNIDQHAIDFEREGDLANLWVRYRNNVSDEKEREKAQFEIDYLLHYTLGGEYISLW